MTRPGIEKALAIVQEFTPATLERFRDSLDEKWIAEALEATGTATIRRRRIPAEQAVWLIIGMALIRNQSIQDVVKRLDLALPTMSGDRTVARSAVTQARERLGASPLQWLFEKSGRQWGQTHAAKHPWRGLSLYSVDGTTVRVPDSASNCEEFGHANGPRGESGYPIVRMSVLMAIRSHMVVGAEFGEFHVDERVYAKPLWEMIPSDSMVLLDKNYLQAPVLNGLTRHGRHFLVPAKKNSAWKVIHALSPHEAIVEMKIQSYARKIDSALPKTYQARAITYQRKGFAPRTLLTSLLDAKAYPAKELCDLYHERWEIELGFDEMKTHLLERAESLRSQSPNMIRQEIWGMLIAYNLIRLEMARVADTINTTPCRISFVAAVRFIVGEWHQSLMTSAPGNIPKNLLSLRDTIRMFLLPPRRTERRFPRAVKIKMSNYKKKGHAVRKRSISLPDLPK